MQSLNIVNLIESNPITKLSNTYNGKLLCKIKENFTESYGIFSGKATKICKLKFSPNRARWVSTENWHPKQVGVTQTDGSYILEFPFNQDFELIMDIMISIISSKS
jgi:hypothetical protein